MRRSAGISAVNADNCYDRIAHPIASLVFQALGVPQEAVVSLLSTIQDMWFFLRTGFGNSKAYAGSNNGESKHKDCVRGMGRRRLGGLS
jgi:hypothetical protein